MLRREGLLQRHRETQLAVTAPRPRRDVCERATELGRQVPLANDIRGDARVRRPAHGLAHVPHPSSAEREGVDVHHDLVTEVQHLHAEPVVEAQAVGTRHHHDRTPAVLMAPNQELAQAVVEGRGLAHRVTRGETHAEQVPVRDDGGAVS